MTVEEGCDIKQMASGLSVFSSNSVRQDQQKSLARIFDNVNEASPRSQTITPFARTARKREPADRSPPPPSPHTWSYSIRCIWRLRPPRRSSPAQSIRSGRGHAHHLPDAALAGAALGRRQRNQHRCHLAGHGRQHLGFRRELRATDRIMFVLLVPSVDRRRGRGSAAAFHALGGVR